MKMLWFSRHAMTTEQLDELFKAYGSDLQVKQVSITVSSAQEILDLGEGCDVLGVVLPPNILAELVNPRINRKPVLRAVSLRVPTGTKNEHGEEEFKFVHDHWEIVDKVEVVTHRLLPD